MDYTVTVAREFEELMPAFLENRRKELAALRAAMSSDDFEGLRLLGDRMKGIGNSYGFARVSTIGKLIEASALGGDRTALRVLVAQYEDYLAKVRVAFE